MKHPTPEGPSQLRIIPRPDHNVSRANISQSALKVLYRLKDAGYQAFLVGGGVRDLLLGLQPKDFDVATDASPEDVKRLFRNARLIGRRFRLAHVRFGREIIEVATFRGSAAEEEDSAREIHGDTGRILRDNVYGAIDEDVWRRDFTANALYYNIADFSIWDYVGGIDDVRDRVMRPIGDAETRYREDPVRMLRAVRLAAKLGFRIARDAESPLSTLADLLGAVPAARLFEEVLKLFHSGHAVASYESLRHYGLFEPLFPDTARSLQGPNGEEAETLLRRAFSKTDKRILDNQAVSPMFLFAVLLWGPTRDRAAGLMEREALPEAVALSRAAQEVVSAQQLQVSLPRRHATPMREVLSLQPRFQQRRGRRAERLLEHRRFRAAYDFFLLRSECGEASPELAQWWTDIQEQEGEKRELALGLRSGPGQRKRRRRRRGGGRRRPDTAPET